MPTNIETRVDQRRGCGWRKPGGLYLVSDGLAMPCGKLPIELTVCPCCGAGVKVSRGWTWINLDAFAKAGCRFKKHLHLLAGECAAGAECGACPLSQSISKAGLLFIGQQFYATPGAFLNEAEQLGVSRRISQVPREFVLGETWVALAHAAAIEYVVTGEETDEELDRMAKRGITPVRVVRAGQTEFETFADAEQGGKTPTANANE